MLCSKNPQVENDIHPKFLLMVGIVRWSKLPGCQKLKDEKNSPLTINNYLLDRIGVTIISNIFIERNCRLFIWTPYSFLAVLEAPGTEKELVIWTETCLPLHRVPTASSCPKRTQHNPTSQLTTFLNSLIFIYSVHHKCDVISLIYYVISSWSSHTSLIFIMSLFYLN